MTPVPDPYADSSAKRRLVMAVAGVLGAVAAVLAILFATGILRLGGKAADPIVRQEVKRPAPILQQKTDAAPPITPVVAEQGPKMPDDVRQYLEWVAKIENEKTDLSNRQYTDMQTLKASLSVGGLGSAADVENMASPDGTFASPLNKLSEKIDAWKNDWFALEARFRSVEPPTECRELRNRFGAGLGQIGGQMADVSRTFASLNPDLGDVREEANASIAEANRIKGGHQQYVDNELAKADAEVGKICDRYSERKWFSIDAQGKMGSMFGM